MKKLPLLFIFLCLNLVAQIKPASFTAYIENRTKDTIMLTNGQLTHGSALYADTEGVFKRTDLNITSGLFTVYYSRDLTFNVFLKPGKHVILKADERDFIATLTFEGDCEEENNWIANHRRNVEKFNKSYDSLGNDTKALRKLNSHFNQKTTQSLRDNSLDTSFVSAMLFLHDREYKQILGDIETAEITTALKGKPSPGFKFENYEGGISRLKDFKGKYVFIDVWATWCGPCMYQLPYLEKLKEQYKDENIVFAGISLDKKKDKDKWRKVIAENNLTGIHLLADKDFGSSFAEDYGITSIPRFILIGPDGTVIDADAPKPFEPELAILLDSVLKGKQ